MLIQISKILTDNVLICFTGTFYRSAFVAYKPARVWTPTVGSGVRVLHLLTPSILPAAPVWHIKLVFHSVNVVSEHNPESITWSQAIFNGVARRETRKMKNNSTFIYPGM